LEAIPRSGLKKSTTSILLALAVCASFLGAGEGRTNRVLAPQTCFREEEEKEEERNEEGGGR
jgi:hypothetical protein